MKKLMFVLVALALGTSACAGSRIATRSDTLMQRCGKDATTTTTTGGRGTETDLCRDMNAGS